MTDSGTNDSKNMGKWNYRVMAHKEKDGMYFRIHEVYYDKNNKPRSYSTNGATIGDEKLSGLMLVMDNVIECVMRPVLYAGDRFPEEYEPTKKEMI